MKIIKKILQKKSRSNKFSEFITDYPSKEKVKIIREAARGANRDQKNLVERYDRQNVEYSV